MSATHLQWKFADDSSGPIQSWSWKPFPKLGALQKRGEFENACKDRSHCNCISVPVRLDMHELAFVFSTHLSTSVKCTSSVSKGIGVDAECPSRALQFSCATAISRKSLLVVAQQSLCCANAIWRHKHILQLSSQWEKLHDQIEVPA